MSCCYAVKSTRSIVLLQPPHELDGTMDSCREQFAAVNGNSLIRVITIISRCKSLVAGRFRIVPHFLRSYMLFYSHFLPKSRLLNGLAELSRFWRVSSGGRQELYCLYSSSQRCFTFRHTHLPHSTLLNTTAQHSEETSASLHSYTL